MGTDSGPIPCKVSDRTASEESRQVGTHSMESFQNLLGFFLTSCRRDAFLPTVRLSSRRSPPRPGLYLGTPPPIRPPQADYRESR